MLANRVREYSITTGTGDIALGGAMAGHIRFGDAFTAGDSVIYVIEDGDNYEIGTGTYGAGNVLARTSISETLEVGVLTRSGALAITLSGQAKIYCAATAEFLLDPTEAADTITEVTPGVGVTVDGVLLKDGAVSAGAGTFSGTGQFGDDITIDTATFPALILQDVNTLTDARIVGTAGNIIYQADNADAVGGSYHRFDVDGVEELRIEASGATFLGDIFLGSTDITRDVNTSVLGISGGLTTSQGAAVILYGNAHPTLANNIALRSAGSDKALYDASANSWAFTATSSTFSGAVVVGAGVSSDYLTVNAGAGWADLNLSSANTNGGSINWIDPETTQGAPAGEIFYYHVSDAMEFKTAGTLALTLDASQNAVFSGIVGIGNTVPSSYPFTDLVVGGNDTNAGLTIATTGAFGQATLSFADGTASSAEWNAGFIQYQHNVNTMAFGTANTQALIIDSSQNATFAGDVGIGAAPTSRALEVTATSGVATVAAFKNTASDEAHVGFIGQLGTNDFDVRVGSSGANDFVVYTANTLALTIDSTQNATFSGEVTSAGFLTAATNITNSGSIRRLIDNSSMLISGGNTDGSGGNVIFYGASHATRAGDILFRQNITELGGWDASLAAWDFKTFEIRAGSATFAGDVTLFDTLTVTGSGAANIKVGNTSGLASGAVITLDGWDGAATAGGGRIIGQLDGSLRLDSSGTVTALTLDSTQNATFAGDVALTDGVLSVYRASNLYMPMSTSVINGNVEFAFINDAQEWKVGNVADTFRIRNQTLLGDAFTINAATNAATFASDVTITGTYETSGAGRVLRLMPDHGVFGASLGTTNGYGLTFYTNATLALALSGTDQSATFASDVTVDRTGLSGVSLQVQDILGVTQLRGRRVEFDGEGFIGTTNVTDLLLKTNNITALTIDPSQNTTFAGDVSLSDNAITSVRSISGDAANTGNLNVSGGNATSAGGNIELRGGAHATQANDIFFRGGTTTALHWDNSLSTWDFQNKWIVGVNSITLATAFVSNGVVSNNPTSELNLSGSNGINDGGNIILFGGSHATNANDIAFRADTANVLNYDDSLSTWDFQGTDIVNFNDLIGTAGSIIKCGTNASSMVFSGGSAGTSGSNFILYGGTHATNANDIFFRAGANDVLTYDRSLTNWNFRSSSLVGVNDLQLVADTGIHSTGTITSLQIAGGSDINSGGNILLRGQGHLTEANDILFRAGTGIKARWDNSASTWDFQGNALAGVGDLTKSTAFMQRSTNTDALWISGGTSSINGANIILTGGAHATSANDIRFRADATEVLVYDDSLSTWDFQDSNITTTGFVGHGTPATLTIATGVVTATGSFHLVDTEASAATDDLDTINGGSDGDVLYLQAANIARTVVVKDGTGNLLLSGDFSLDNTNDILTLIRIGLNWKETSRSDNAA